MADGSDDQGELHLPEKGRGGLPGLDLHPRQALESTHKPHAEEQHRRDMEQLKERHAQRMDWVRMSAAAVFLATAAFFFVSHPEVWSTGTNLVSAAIGAMVSYLFSVRRS